MCLSCCWRMDTHPPYQVCLPMPRPIYSWLMPLLFALLALVGLGGISQLPTSSWAWPWMLFAALIGLVFCLAIIVSFIRHPLPDPQGEPENQEEAGELLGGQGQSGKGQEG